MDFAPTPAQERLREEVPAFLREQLAPADVCDDGWIVGFSREFSRALGERGWIGYTCRTATAAAKERISSG